MKNLILAIALLCSASIAQAERVTVLPEDGNRNYLSVIGAPGDAQCEAAKQWLKTDKSLVAAKAACHYCELTTDQKMYDRYVATVGAVPCIRLQASDGKVLYQASGKSFPKSASELAGKMCPWCKPKPSPKPEPVKPDPQPVVQPDVQPEPDSPSGPSTAILLGLAAAGGAAGTVGSYRKQYYGRVFRLI